jgi:hypothetical protein
MVNRKRNKMERALIIGKGEIGKSLYKVFHDAWYNIDIRDTENTLEDKDYDILHISFPYSDSFIDDVRNYQSLYNPKYTIIHSTVPVGTSKKCDAIHSPVIGIHPHLAQSLKTFTKFLAGEKASEVADYFRRAGIKVYLLDNQEESELMKVLSTTYYATMIEYVKEVKRQCKKNNVPFTDWTVWNENYNNGYNKLGYPEYTRPNLVPIMKEQGGHCTIPNLSLLESEFTKFIKEQNANK